MKHQIIFAKAFALLLLASCGNKKTAITPEVKNITESVYASGIIKSKNQYEVFSKTNGILKTVLVKEGAVVKKGDALFEIDNSNVRLTTENARLAAGTADYNTNLDKLNDAKNAIELARKKLNTDSLLYVRQKNLWDNNIGAKIELEQKELNYENSKNIFASALVRYEDLQRQLKLASGQSKNNLRISKTLEDDLIIHSDFDGMVYKINKEQGEMVTSQIPVAVIGDAQQFIVELNVDEHDIVKVKTGQQVLIRMDSYKEQVFEATISVIDPMMNDRTRTFKAEALFTRKPDALYPNLTVEANIVISAKQGALTIPRNCLVNDSTVMLEDGNLQKVETGLKDYNLVEIKSGITSATKIKLPLK
ncbi:MAG: efflux RND transporter periplasmic adaptor subunit [Bacteroidia bacterium]